MPTVIEKDVLWPGTVVKGGKTYTFNPADLDNAADVGNAKVTEGWTIPLSWDHQGTLPFQAGQLTKDELADLTRNTFGRIKLFRRGPTVKAALEIDDEADLKALRSIKHVSPLVQWDWVDSTGKKWPGLTIAHVAATARAVVKDQEAFALSHAGERLALSFGDYDMADEKPEETEKPKPEEKPKEDTPMDGAAWMKKALGMLAQKGIVVADEGTTPENVWERVCIALTAIEGAEAGADKPAEEPSTVGEVNQPAPLMMSHAAEAKAIARAKALAHREITGRISRLVSTGRITPDLGRKLASQANKVELSFADDGELAPNDLLVKLSAYEDLAKHTAWKPKGDKVELSHTEEVKPPADLRGDQTTKSDDELLKEWDAAD